MASLLHLLRHLKDIPVLPKKLPAEVLPPPYPKHIFWWSLELGVLGLQVLQLPKVYALAHWLFKSKYRRLTPEEIALAHSVFGNAIVYERVRVDEKAYLGPKQHHFAYVSFDIVNSWGKLGDAHFIHEMVHVWQYQRVGAVYIPRALYAQRTREGYNYGGVSGLLAAKDLTDFNYEQQGDVVADYYLLRLGDEPCWVPKDRALLSEFERLLKPHFGGVV